MSGRGSHWDGVQWRDGANPAESGRARSRSRSPGANNQVYVLTEDDRIFLTSVLDFAGITTKLQNEQEAAAVALNPSCPKCNAQGSMCRICEKLGVMGVKKSAAPQHAAPNAAAYNAAYAAQYAEPAAVQYAEPEAAVSPAAVSEAQLQMLWLAAHGALQSSEEPQQPEATQMPSSGIAPEGMQEHQAAQSAPSQWDIHSNGSTMQSPAPNGPSGSSSMPPGMTEDELLHLALQMGGVPPPSKRDVNPLPMIPSTMQPGAAPAAPAALNKNCPKCQKLGTLCKICEKLATTKEEVKKEAGFDISAPLPYIEYCPIRKFKVIPLDASQVRALIGKNGETIRHIRQRCPVTEVLIGHEKHQSHGILRLTGDIEAAEAVVKDRLLAKGCLTPTIAPQTVANTAFNPILTEFPVAEVMPSNSRRDR